MNNKIKTNGKNLETKIDSEMVKRLEKCFLKYDLTGAWNSLFSMINVFKDISKQLASDIEYNYPERKIDEIERYVYKIYREIKYEGRL